MSFYVERYADDASVDLLPWAGSVSGSLAPEMKSAALKAADVDEHKPLASND
jgi:hypothetical protein